MSNNNGAASASAEHFTCNVCHRHLKTQRGLERHRAVHDRLSCDECGAQFTQSDSIARHNLSYHGINTPHCKEVPSKDAESQNTQSDTRGESDEQMEDVDDGDLDDEYQLQIFSLQEQLEEEREGRRMEIADMHTTYKRKLEELMAKGSGKDKELEKSIKEVHDSIPL
ncbi:uncharacterized protein PG986_003901 [Apiospora aurea]|uniref:C2H2-type domain-containing protein n=1 Tax=Apiospora aurea TaxID=335848 RepID=A0ABR1QL15_9PEZI